MKDYVEAAANAANKIIRRKIFPDEIYIGKHRISNRDINIAVCSVGILTAGTLMVKTYFSEDMQLRMLDGNADESCYSYNPESNFQSQTAQERAENILGLMAQFRIAGNETATDFRNRGAGVCSGMSDESVNPTAIWPRLDWHFAATDYPDDMAAMTFYEPVRQAYWNNHIHDPNVLNAYTFESALLFSRLTRATNIAGQIADMVEANADRYGANGWETYIAENPELETVIRSFLENYNYEAYYTDILKTAIDSYLQDPQALAVGDESFLRAYLDHVSILEISEYTGLYDGPQWGNYAKVDADRDGLRDDVIYMGYGYHQQEIWYDAEFAWRLSRQEYSYPCGTSESPQTCWADESATVHFQRIPAIETGTVNIDPQTIVALGQLTHMNLWNMSEAQNIAENPAYIQPLSEENQNLFDQIRGQIAANIPGRNMGETAPNYGLQNLDPE